MQQDTDVPFQQTAGPGGAGMDSLDEFHDLIAMWAAEMLLLKEEALGQHAALKAERLERVTELREHMTQINLNDPKRVRIAEDDWGGEW